MSNTSTAVIIYFIGFWISWFIIRWLYSEDELTWEDLRIRVGWSTLSWITIAALILILVVVGISWVIEKIENNFPGPPKWLK